MQNSLFEEEATILRWLTNGSLAKVLQGTETRRRVDIEIEHTKLSMVNIAYDEHVSLVIRLGLDYWRNNIKVCESFIVKFLSQAEKELKAAGKRNECFMFLTELGVYTELLPKFVDLLRAAEDNANLSARYLYNSSLEKDNFVVLEDLGASGYSALSAEGLSLDHARVFYAKLAKFHAVSCKLLQDNPSIFEKYSHNFMSLPNLIDDDTVKATVDNFIETLEKSNTLATFKTYFVALRDILRLKCKHCFAAHCQDSQHRFFSALCHGNLHCINVFFKYCEDSLVPVDALFIDFKFSHVGSIASDLISATYRFLSPELRLKHYDELLACYFENFVATLRQLGLEDCMPTLEELKEQMMQQKYYELFAVVMYLKICYEEPTFSERGVKYEYEHELHELLTKFLKLGYFVDLNK